MKLLLLLPTIIFADLWSSLNDSQQSYIKYAYNYCKPYNLSNSCAAIAYKESAGGKYQISVYGSDYGLMQISLKNHMRRHNIKPTLYTESQVATKLIVDIDYNLDAAITELQYWNSYHKGNWLLTWGSYNGGHSPNLNYAYDIANIIKQLKEHL